MMEEANIYDTDTHNNHNVNVNADDIMVMLNRT